MEESLASMQSKRHPKSKSPQFQARILAQIFANRPPCFIALGSNPLTLVVGVKLTESLGSPLSLLQLTAADRGKSWILFFSYSPLF